MYYQFALTIPANTPKTAPTELVCNLSHGTIVKVTVGFPPGPKGLAHLVIYRFEHQVWPTNPDGSFAWDNHVIEFASEFKLESWPYKIKLVGWNLDDTYEHTVTVGLNISRGEYDLSRLLNMRMPIDVGSGG